MLALENLCSFVNLQKEGIHENKHGCRMNKEGKEA